LAAERQTEGEKRSSAPAFYAELIGFWTMKNALLRIYFVKNTKMTRNYYNFVDSPAGQV